MIRLRVFAQVPRAGGPCTLAIKARLRRDACCSPESTLKRVQERSAKMPFKRYVEIGRVALVTFGEDYGKLVVISDVVDQNRALVDAPTETRKVIGFKRLQLTDLKVEIPRLANKKVLTEAFNSADVAGKFASSAWGKKLAARSSKAATSDFDRYKAAIEKSKRNRAIRKALNQLKKSA